jgi:DegV family protein with EDD domain
MSKIGFIVDSTFTIDKAFAKKHDIHIVPLTVFINGTPNLDGTVTVKDLEQAFLSNADLKTSQPTPEQYVKAYEEQLKKYDQLLVLTLAKSLSGTYNSAMLAKDSVEDGSKITIFDTESTGAGGLYFMEQLAELRESGADVKALVAKAEEIKNKGLFFITVDDLKYLIKGGRITKTKAMIGNLLKKKPILKFKSGKLELEQTVRAFAGVKTFIVEEAKKLLDASKKKVVVYINFVDDEERAKVVKEALLELGSRISIRIVGTVSPVVSAHVGLGTLGIYLVTE